MALLQISFFSDVLNVGTSVNVILPEVNQGIGIVASRKEELPKVLYLLHGYSDDHSIWMRRTSVERYAAAYNLAVIMPAVNHSFYCNERYGERYWDYVSEELPRVMHRFLRLSARPEDTYVAGLSMGGYGSMRLALTYPERFAGAASFSGAVNITEIMGLHDQDGTGERIFGDRMTDLKDTEVDLYHLMKKNADSPHKPWLYVSCGTDDFLYPFHQTFVPALVSSKWDVTEYEEEGAIHEWGFWDREIRKFIDLMFAGKENETVIR